MRGPDKHKRSFDATAHSWGGGQVNAGFRVRKEDSSDLHVVHMPRTLPSVFLGEHSKASRWSQQVGGVT